MSAGKQRQRKRTRLDEAAALGQSIWYDDLGRGLLRAGELARVVESGVRGLTSNPTIFERAIVSSSDYEEALRKLVAERRRPGEIYEELVLEDIRGACDLLCDVFDASDGVDGRVSLEVLPELAANTDATVSEGLRLAHIVGRPNIMIKVPGTPEGIPAVRALTAQGVSVNVTLIFSLLQYEEVLEAYLAGLEDRLAAGRPLDDVASVASFFVSRVDSACDKLLDAQAAAADAAPGVPERCRALRGHIAIANCKLAYDLFRQTVAGERWQALEAKGARPQRLLWASTGSKDPSYPDTLYVDALIGPDTVNTVPPATLRAFADHGQVEGATVTEGLAEAQAAIAEFEELGFDLPRVCHGLLADGVKSFTRSMTTLMDAITGRRAAILEQSAGRQRLVLPPALAPAVSAEVERLTAAQALRRLWDGDATLFTPDPDHEKSIKSRLGWLRSPALMREKVAELEAFRGEVVEAGFTDAVLLGMGGSSLCPEVLSLTFPAEPGGLRLHVLDNTDPAAVLRVERETQGKKTLYLVASKSGGTIEIQAFEHHFWQRALAASNGDPARAGACFAAITDPATRLGQLAEEKRYRRVFVNPADIGGRYSAISYFGLVPAALLAVDLRALVDTAIEMAAASSPVVAAAESPGLVLGAALAAAARAGRDKLTFVMSPGIRQLGAWIEQLVAESTGKDGKGIVPVDLEPLGPLDAYGADRFFAHVTLRSEGDDAGARKQEAAVAALERAGHPVARIALDDRAALGRELFRWEIATAIAGAGLGLNPFDEPNVTEAKLATGALLQAHGSDGKLPEPEEVSAPDDAERIRRHLDSARPGDYLAFSAYFMRTDARDDALAHLRVLCRARGRNATTVGYGPRFLHSTGQLHKGGPATGVYLQLTADAREDLPIPGEPYSFATLRNAQALGDLQVLRRRGRRVLRVHLGRDADAGLAALLGTVESLAATRKSA
jgi:transaldolase/glucose-6-phosphate isomerase